MAPTDFRRIPHRLPAEEYVGKRWFFVTMCCYNRIPLFLNAPSAAAVLQVLQTDSIHHQFLIDAYCVMPDHLHFLAVGTSATSNLLKFAKSFKQKTTFSHLQRAGKRLWQKNFYDHILRSSEESHRVAAYIWLNPIQKGLCKDFQDYPFSGSFSRPWKVAVATSWIPPWRRSQMPA